MIEDRDYKKGEEFKTLKGTYLLGKVDDAKYVIWNTNREPVKVKMKDDFERTIGSKESRFSYYKLNGPAYFNFFAWMMFITSILFIPFAIKMKNKTYLQG